MKKVNKYIEIIKETMKRIFDEENLKGIEINVCWQEARYKEQA